METLYSLSCGERHEINHQWTNRIREERKKGAQRNTGINFEGKNGGIEEIRKYIKSNNK
jgi:hypothetical protein